MKEPCKTTIYTYPLNEDMLELGHYDYMNDCLNLTDTGKLNFDAAPWIEYLSGPGLCTSGNLQLSIWKFMEQDGRLVKKFVSNVTFTP